MAFCFMPKQGNFERLRKKDFEYLESNNFLFTDKMSSMVGILQMTEEEVQEKNRIVAKMYDILKPYYPECDIIVFGSSMNGFGFKGCDLDLLFLPFPEYCNLDFKGKGNSVIPAPYNVLQGKYSREEILFMEEETHLKFVQRVMFAQRNIFKKVLFIPAKCPILNIQFVGNRITCDFSASNRLVMSNTELLWFFGVLDDRVRPLVIVLRYWAKSTGFIAKSLLSSYAFTLMIMFFLQNTEPSILPSVRSLIELADFSRVIDGWETAVSLDHSRIPKSKNSSSSDELLVQFFEFYWNFDFVQNVVSPYHGKPLPVKELIESKNERIREFQITPFSIQDPFHLSRNLSRNCNMKTSFKLALLIAKKLVLEEKFQPLFNFAVYQRDTAAVFESAKKDCSDIACFPLYLTYALSCALSVTSHLKPWYKKVCQTVLDVLQYGLLTECEVVDSVTWDDECVEGPFKKMKDAEAKCVENLQLLMSIQCGLHLNALLHRKSVLESDLEDEEDDDELPNSLKTHFKISNHIIKSDTDASPVLWFMCQCYKYSSAQIPDVVVTFTPLNEEGTFYVKKDVLCNLVQKLVKKILDEDSTPSASVSSAN